MAKHKSKEYIKNGFVMSLGIVIFLFLNPVYGFKEEKDNPKTNATLQRNWGIPKLHANKKLQKDGPKVQKEQKPQVNISEQNAIVKNFAELVGNISNLLQKSHIEFNKNYYMIGGKRKGQKGQNRFEFDAMNPFGKLFHPNTLLKFHQSNHGGKNDKSKVRLLIQKIYVLLVYFQNFLLNLDCVPKEYSSRGPTNALKSALKAIHKLRVARKLLHDAKHLHTHFVSYPSYEEYSDKDDSEDESPSSYGDDYHLIDKGNDFEDDKDDDDEDDDQRQEHTQNVKDLLKEDI